MTQTAPQQGQEFFEISTSNGTVCIKLSGSWDLVHLRELSESFTLEDKLRAGVLTVDGAALQTLDTSGAMILREQLIRFNPTLAPNELTKKAQLRNFKPEHTRVFSLVCERLGSTDSEPSTPSHGIIHRIGVLGVQFVSALQSFLAFLGRATVECLRLVAQPTAFRIKEFSVQLEQSFVNAIPIVCLVTFLIGIVVAYLLAQQIEKYGASVFIVDGISIAMCRELSPIIVAIIVAGRSGSAYTAQIGSMKLNEEVDALVALGLSPLRVLVLPRVLALVVAMPLLVFVGDVVGIFGGVVIGDTYLGVRPTTFMDRLHVVLTLKSLMVGLGKAPVFAFLIALIGCRMGLESEPNARSVGLSTTSTVVQAIVVVIILNAIFAVVLTELGI